MSTSTLPRHALTGRTAIGWRKARRGEDGPQPIWPILGGAPGDDEDDQDDDTGDDQGDGTDGGQDDDGDGGDNEPLREAGTKALAAEKARRKAEADKRRTAEARIAELESQLSASKKGEGDGPDPDQIRREATTAATAQANARILRSEVRAAAAGKLADPRDALRFLNLDQFEVDEDGQVDEDEIADAIEDLVKNKPYLAAATAGGKPRFQGTGDGGARKAPDGPKQYTESDVKKMTPEQIDEAHRKGQLRDYMGS